MKKINSDLRTYDLHKYSWSTLDTDDIISRLVVSNGILEFYHQQDCCEHVYADLTALEDTAFNSDDINIYEMRLENVENLGFRINEYFVPCYNEQNGYYSDELVLIIRDINGDIVGCYELSKKDDIY